MRPVAGIVLAAGRSTRMGGDRSKLVEDVGGRPMVVWPLAALAEAGAEPLIVVLGYQADLVRRAIAGRIGASLYFVDHPGFRAGLGSSIARGVGELPRLAPEVDGVLLVLGDLPALRARHVRSLREAFEGAGDEAICVATHGGRRGHPVLFGRSHFEALRALSGRDGARALIERAGGGVLPVEIGSDACLQDVDTPEALAALRRSDRVPGEGL